MATTKRKPKKKKEPGDSPITVGGGGGFGKILKLRGFLEDYVYIYLDNNWYTSKPGDPEQHWNKDDEITMLTVYDGIAGTPHPEADPTRTITIPCRSANGHNSPIAIKGKSLGVKFKLQDYDYDYVNRVWVSKVPRTMGDIKISGKPDVPHAPVCVIVVDNKLKHRPWKPVRIRRPKTTKRRAKVTSRSAKR